MSGTNRLVNNKGALANQSNSALTSALMNANNVAITMSNKGKKSSAKKGKK